MKPTFSLTCQTMWSCLTCCLAFSIHAAETLDQCSPDGIHTVSSEHGRILYCHANDGRVEHTFYICNAQALAFSEDGKLLAAAGGRNGSQSKIKIWRLSDHKQLCGIVVGGEGINALAVSSDEKFIAAVDKNGTIEAWRVSDRQRQWSRNLSPTIDTLHFLTDGTRLVVRCADGSQRFMDTLKGRNALQAKITKE